MGHVQSVMARNLRPGPDRVPAVVVERLGPLTYLVIITSLSHVISCVYTTKLCHVLIRFVCQFYLAIGLCYLSC
jgi:hypothetical protein